MGKLVTVEAKRNFTFGFSMSSVTYTDTSLSASPISGAWGDVAQSSMGKTALWFLVS